MKKIFFTTSLILLFVLSSLLIVLSTLGYETDKFSRVISEKIHENNQNILLKLELGPIICPINFCWGAKERSTILHI